MKKVLNLYRPRNYAVFSSQSYYKYKTKTHKLEQAVSESLPHKGLYTELLGVQLTCVDPVPASIRARNAQEIQIVMSPHGVG